VKCRIGGTLLYDECCTVGSRKIESGVGYRADHTPPLGVAAGVELPLVRTR
jgi:hypothetical protein